VRSLSETNQTSSQGTGGGPSGNAIAAPSGSSISGFDPTYAPNDERSAESLGGGAAAGFLAGLIIGGEGGAFGAGVVGAVIGAVIGGVTGFFEALFGGGSSSPAIPRQELHARHPLYDWFLGIVLGLLPDLKSAANIISAPGAAPLNVAPLQKEPPGVVPVEFAGQPGNPQQQNGQLCRQAAEAQLRKRIGQTAAVVVSGASLPCEATLLAGPEAFELCDGLTLGLAVPPLAGAVGTCIARYHQQVNRCGQ